MSYNIYIDNGFSSKAKIDGKEVIGNPASIVILDYDFPSQEEMSRIAIEENQPITVFAKARADTNNQEFDVRYFNPTTGTDVVLCGHGSIVLAKIITKHVNTESKSFIFHYANGEKKIDVEIEDDLVCIKLPVFTPHDVNYHTPKVVALIHALNLWWGDIKKIYKTKEFNDYVVVLKDVNVLRSLNPDTEDFNKAYESLDCRGIFCTAQSDLEGITFETRNFMGCFERNEEACCGSANCSTVPCWIKELGITGDYSFNVLYPYNEIEKYYGGLQEIEYNQDSIILKSE